MYQEHTFEHILQGARYEPSLIVNLFGRQTIYIHNRTFPGNGEASSTQSQRLLPNLPSLELRDSGSDQKFR